jgi:long-chain acyl-CoA synthetase
VSLAPTNRLIAGKRACDYAEILARAARAASAFKQLGIGEDDVIALFLRNDFAFFEASIAAAMIGAYATPLNWHGTAAEARYILEDSGAKALVVHTDLWPAIAAGVPHELTVLMVATAEEICAAYGLGKDVSRLPQGALAWDTWLEAHSAWTQPPAPMRGAMIYTSGTTGQPKGVRRTPLPAEPLARMQAASAAAYGLTPGARMVVLMNGPMYHSAPNSYGLAAARLGADVILQPRFDAEDLLALIERHRVTHMHIVPTMFHRLLNLPQEVRRRYDVSSLRDAVHGAAPCPLELKRQMIDWWGPVISEYYGSTETGLMARNNSEEALRKPGTVGKAIPGCTIRILGDEGEELPSGEIGDVYVRIAHMPDFTYHGHPEKRRQASHDGFVTVGDMGWMDEDGYLFLCDRKHDMVISGGVNIYPAEIEAALHGIGGVRDCAVFGIPDAEFGEQLCAYIERDPQAAPLTADEVRARLAGSLAKFKIPKVIEFTECLPREDSGKIFKRKLRAPYWEKARRNI